MSNLKHARFWKYDGNHHNGMDCKRHDPHGFGLELISAMAYVAEEWSNSFGHPDSEYGQLLKADGGDLSGVVVRHHKGDSFGHQVHVAATAEQWAALAAAKDAVDSAYKNQLSVDDSGV